MASTTTSTSTSCCCCLDTEESDCAVFFFFTFYPVNLHTYSLYALLMESSVCVDNVPIVSFKFHIFMHGHLYWSVCVAYTSLVSWKTKPQPHYQQPIITEGVSAQEQRACWLIATKSRGSMSLTYCTYSNGSAWVIPENEQSKKYLTSLVWLHLSGRKKSARVTFIST